MKAQISSVLAGGTFLGMDLQQTGFAFVVLLATATFYFGWIPKIIKMFGALTSPKTMTRNDFEDGMDMYLRLSSLGFKSALTRNREIERAWAVIEDDE